MKKAFFQTDASSVVPQLQIILLCLFPTLQWKVFNKGGKENKQTHTPKTFLVFASMVTSESLPN